MKDENYNLLLQKLDDFIRKFYFNKLIRGSIYFFSLALLIFLLAVGLEYFGNFGSQLRTILFYSSSAILICFLLLFIVYPLTQILSLGKRISHEQASQIIGKHFREVDDKLYNVLQLKRQASETPSQLIEASINQKIEGLNPVPFRLAIRLGENKKYLKYLMPPLVVIIALLVFSPQIISESTNRLVAHDMEFTPMAPFEFSILNEKMQAFKGEDFKLKVKVSGSEIPLQLYIRLNNQKYLMNKEGKHQFSFAMKNLRKTTDFYMTDERFDSKIYRLKVLPKAALANIKAKLNYPPYLGLKNEVIENSGDLSVPEGTEISWRIGTSEADRLYFLINDTAILATQSGEDEFSFKKRLFKSDVYGLIPQNDYSNKNDTALYNIEVIPDLRPSIEVESKIDSNNLKVRYFKGLAKDDHGFSRLVFHSQFIGENDSLGKRQKEEIPFDNSLSQIEFYYNWSTAKYNLKSGDKVDFYFEVWDNDGVNGAKSARTQTFVFQAPTNKNLKEEEEKSNRKIKDVLAENIKLSKDIKKELEELKQSMLNKKKLGYQEKKKLEKLLEKQKQLRENTKKLNKENQQKNKQQSEYNEMSEELMEKQKQLEELMENVMSDEMKKMMEEMEKLLEELNKDKLQEQLEKMEMSNEEMAKEMDRNLELFKQLEFEKQLNDAAKKLDEIKKEQKALKEKTKDSKKKGQEELSKKQEELNEKFEELSEDLDKLEEKNKELENPNEMKDTKSLEEQIKEDMKESSEQLSKMQMQKAGEQQENAEEGMDKLSESLTQMQMEMEESQHAENLKDLRALLENLVQLSFDQEDVMENFKNTNQNDPKYVELAQQQSKLQDDAKIIEDSLYALSKRVIQLKSIVNKEMSSINNNMQKAVDELGERNTGKANARQQLSMTSLNNLALILDESMQQMQKEMQSMMDGKGKCKKPGDKPGGKPSPGGMKKLQQQLNKQMEQLKKAMQDGEGKEKGGKKPNGKEGEGSQGGSGGMSKELVKMAAQQAQIRRAIQKMQEELGKGKNGGGQGELEKLQEMMEETETDLVNKQITRETLMRQEKILSRLLESEKAEREREKEKKRESREFTDEFSRNPKNFFEYNKKKESEIELLRTLPPSFSPFYKSKVTEYFNSINK